MNNSINNGSTVVATGSLQNMQIIGSEKKKILKMSVG